MDATKEGVAIATLDDLDDACATCSGNCLRTVRAAIVSHDDLANHSVALQEHLRLGDAPSDRFCLVEARHHDREF